MTQQDFDRRFDRLFGYIEQNLEGDLSVERLSQVACLSKFHFHRVFSSSYGLSIGKYLQLIKLKRAAYQLAFSPEYKIIDIAFDAGFETPGTFSRAFRHAFGLTPSQFRKKPDWTLWHERCSFKRIKRTRRMDVSVVDFPAVKVAVFEHRGPAEQVNATAKAFVQWRKDSGLSPRETSRTFGIVYDNPETTEPAAFRFDFCGEVLEWEPYEDPRVQQKMIPGGRCAVIRHCGSHDTIGETIRYLYGRWLRESGESLRDFPVFFHYLNFVGETPEHELRTDVYLPLK